ncbi:calcium-binding mitochondrial carrier protein SCaMC-2-A-like [Lycorma delicatula]|uniref:calcium-binding mitochondrial carrier protein SCaMC-2-A-like n=1 Tax=Lycorma delicatula TaxID=130591 RepID=UPI003F5177D2
MNRLRLSKRIISKLRNHKSQGGFKQTKEELKRLCSNLLAEVVDKLGFASAKAQGILKSVTSAERLRNSEHIVYSFAEPEENKMESEIIIFNTDIKTGRWWRYLVAGGAGGAVSLTCTAPLERIKIYLQVHGKDSKNMSTLDVCKQMTKEGGIRSLWRGNGVNVLRVAPDSAVRFTTYEKAKRFIVKKYNAEPNDESFTHISMGERFIAGSIAGAVSQSMTFPLDVLKTQLALGKTNQYRGIIDAAKKIYLNKGIRGFYQGYAPSMVGIVPYSGINLTVYETLKNSYLDSYSDENSSTLLLLGCGAVATTCAVTFCYPLALLRTKMQAHQAVKKDSKEKCPMG